MNTILLPNIGLYLLLLSIISLLSLGVGYIVLCCIGKNTFEKSQQQPWAFIFLSYFWGYVLLITLFAIIWTKGNSIMWIALALLSTLLICKVKNATPPKIRFCPPSLKVAVLSFLLMYISFGVFYYLFFIRSAGTIWCDHTFYANVSAHLATQNIESTDLFTGTLKAATYHWGDLWLTALCGTLVPSNFLYVLLLITYPYLTGLIVLGAIALAKRFISRSYVAILFGLSILFAVPIINILIPWEIPVISSLKFVVIYLFFLAFLLYYQDRQYQPAFISLLLLVPFYSTLAPGVLTMVCTLALFNTYDHKKSFIQNIITNKFIIISFCVCFAYGLFYLLQHLIPENSLLMNERKNELIISGNPLLVFVTFVIKRSARFLMLVPSICCVLWLSKSYKNDYIRLCCAILAGLIISAFVGGGIRFILLDGGQITSNFQVILVIVCWYSILEITKQLKVYKQIILPLFFTLYYVLSFIFCGSGMIYMKSTERLSQAELSNLEKVKYELQSHPNQKIGYFRNYQLDENKNTHRTRLRMFYPFDIMPHLTENGYYAPICLSANNLPDDILPIWDERHMSILCNYMKKSTETTKDTNQQLLNFMSEQHIKYVVVEKSCNLPEYLINRVVEVANFRGDILYRVIDLQKY